MKKWFYIRIFFEITLLNFDYVVFSREESLEENMHFPEKTGMKKNAIKHIAIYELTLDGEKKERNDLSDNILISVGVK
jgi:hypothetical protein